VLLYYWSLPAIGHDNHKALGPLKKLTKSIEQSPSWEANSHSASQAFLCCSWNPNVHYRIHNSPPLVPIPNQMNSVHKFPSCIPTIQFILPTSRSYEWSITFRFSDHNFVCDSHVSHVCYMPSPSHPHWLDHPNNVRWGVQVMMLLIIQSSPSSRHFLPLRSKYSFQHPLLKHCQSVFFP